MDYQPLRELRLAFKLLLTEPVFTTEIARRSFPYSAARTWNGLPHDIRILNNLSTFRKELKTHSDCLTVSGCFSDSVPTIANTDTYD